MFSSRGMTWRIRRAVAAILAILALSGASAVVVEHDHDAWQWRAGSASVRTHDCGAHERHVPLGADHACAVCARILHFVSTVPAAAAAPAFALLPLALSVPVLPPAVRATTLFFRRGPPSVSI